MAGVLAVLYNFPFSLVCILLSHNTSKAFSICFVQPALIQIFMFFMFYGSKIAKLVSLATSLPANITNYLFICLLLLNLPLVLLILKHVDSRASELIYC